MENNKQEHSRLFNVQIVSQLRSKTSGSIAQVKVSKNVTTNKVLKYFFTVRPEFSLLQKKKIK